MSSNTDAELLAQLVSRSDLSTPVNRLVDALWRVDGGFSVVLMDTKRLVAVCDPWGLCSMFLGRSGATVVLASSAKALAASGATIERQLVPGEMAIVENGACMVVRPFARGAAPRTIQDEVGMARGSELDLPSARLTTRREMGAALAQHSPLPKNSVVVGMPGESSYADGYARSCGSRAETAFVLEPGSGWIAQEERVLGRTVVLVVDAVANGDRIKVAAHGLRVAGAQHIVLLVARPMRSGACGWEPKALWSHEGRSDAAGLGVDHLAYLPEGAIPEDVSWSGRGPCGFCHDCCVASEAVTTDNDREQLPLFEG
jgi:amidophosphoribosyltransferase